MPNSKNDKLRKIDIRPPVKGGGSLITSAVTVAPPARGNIGIPLNLRLIDTTIARSTQASMAFINIEWDPPTNFNPDYYEVEYGKASDWTGSGFGNPSRVRAFSTSAALLADADTAYKIRVRAQYKSTVSPYTAVLDVESAIDDVAPPDFDTYSAEFQNGNLVVSYGYSGITPENFKEARIQIYNAAHTVLYADIRNGGRQYIWTESQNLKATLGVGATDVSVDITPVSWTETQGTTVNDTATSVAPDAISSLAYDFATGDLKLSWTNPTNAPFKLISVKIYDDDTLASLYRTIDVLGNNAVWTVFDNFTDTGNNPDPNVFVTIQVVGWLNQASTVVDTNAVKALPDAPATVTTSWDSDTGTADETIVIGWDTVAYVRDYEVTINSKVLYVTDNTYTYSHSENIADNTAPGDPTLTIEVKARDRLLQLSATPTINNAVNAEPNIALANIEYQVGFSSVGGIISFSSTINDYKGILWEILDDTLSPVQVRETTEVVAIFIDLVSGDYTLQARIRDLYDQLSDPIDTGVFTIDALTIEELRQNLKYTDRPGNSEATLDVLKDGNTSGSSVNYTSSYNPDYNWTQAEWPLLERIRTITLKLDDDTDDPYFYIATSVDGATWRYFSGPLFGTYLLEVADQATAETNAIIYSTAGTRVDISPIVEARFIRVYHKTTSSGGQYFLYEFFPRRLIQTDDLEVEAVKAINIGVGEVNANHITVTTLSAVQTSTGTLTVNSGGHIKSGMTAWNTGTGYYFDNNAGTPRFMVGSSSTRMYWDGTNLILEGAALLIRTQSSNQRVELNSGGLYGYNSSGVEQVRIQSTDGKLVAGVGAVTLDSLGIYITTGNASNNIKSYKFYNTGGTLISYYESFSDASNNTSAIIKTTAPTTKLAATTINSEAAGTGFGRVTLTAQGNSQLATIRIDATTESAIYVTATDIRIRGGGGGTDRLAISDINDGWLRLNNSSHYASGVYTPGAIRADGNIYSGGGGTIYTSGNVQSIGGTVAAYDGTGVELIRMYMSGSQGYIDALYPGLAWRQLNIGTTGTSQTWLGNASGHARTIGAFIASNGVYAINGSAVRSESATNDLSLILYSGSANRNELWSANGAWSTVRPLLIQASSIAINATPATNQRLRIATTGDNSSHYPLMVVDASDSNALFYVRSASTTTSTGYLAAASWTYFSDESGKEDITDIPSQKDKLKLLKPKRFKYKGEDKYSLGFTAQDLQAVYPEIVEEITTGEETILGIRSSELLPILVKEVIELREKVDTLESNKADKPEKR